MSPQLVDFLTHWAIMSLSLWVASYVFNGIKFESRSSLVISALMLGFANAIIRPVLWILTLPITFLTLGFFALAINAFMIMLVAKLVNGFKLSGFWTAFFVSIFIAVFGFFIELMLPTYGVTMTQTSQSINI